jgi:hypothetical protein
LPKEQSAELNSSIWLDRARLLIAQLPVKDRERHVSTHFIFNPNQVKLFNYMRKQWIKEGKLRIIVLKARRVGMSSAIEALLWAYCLAFPNKNAKIVAHLAGSAEELFRVPSDLSTAFPSFPITDIQRKRLLFHHPEGDSQITMATAGTPSAGRGGTLSACHLSECAYYPSDESFTAMITSVSKGAGSIIILESTANGREGPGEAFSEYWDNAVAGRSGYIPVFLSWLDDPACIRPAEEAGDAPRDDLEKELMAAPYNASLEQIAWMRRTKDDDCHGLEIKWLIEYPHCPEVAFQVSGAPAFAREELAYAESTIRPPLARGRFERRGVNPLFVKDDNGPLHVWKFPFDAKAKADGNRYYIGADAALGTEEGDFASYVCVCGETGELACRFAERIAPEVLADQLDLAGRFYNRAMVNPELTGNLGRWALIKLRDVYRYPNIYTWKGRDDKKAYRGKSTSLGFEMNQATRRLIIDAARSGLRTAHRGDPGGLTVSDRSLMQQMSLCTIKEWRWDVARGHDDILVAWMIACLTREQYPPARMKYAPKNLMDGELKETLPVTAKQEVSEQQVAFEREIRMSMRSAGLRQNMKGTGRKNINRLQGI